MTYLLIEYFNLDSMNYINTLLFLFFAFFHFNCSAQNTVSIANQKMNIVYTGINNSLSVAAAGVKDKHLRIECKSLKIEKRRAGEYMVKASQPGMAEIVVFKKNKALDTILYRIKKIPTPKALVGTREKGIISPKMFKTQLGLSSYLPNFDIDIKCAIISFDLIYVPKGKDPIEISNSGAQYKADALNLVKQAAIGDYYYFENIMVRCPGDNQMGQMDSTFFKISDDKKRGY